MKSNQFIIFAIVLLIIFTVSSTRVLAKGGTAKNGLVKAKQAAKKPTKYRPKSRGKSNSLVLFLVIWIWGFGVGPL